MILIAATRISAAMRIITVTCIHMSAGGYMDVKITFFLAFLRLGDLFDSS